MRRLWPLVLAMLSLACSKGSSSVATASSVAAPSVESVAPSASATNQPPIASSPSASASRQALAAARLKVVSKPWPKSGPLAETGDQCRTKGKPPILKNYEGDQDTKVTDQVAFAQAELVALADGCVHLFDTVDPNTKEHAAVEYMRKSMFCCPK